MFTNRLKKTKESGFTLIELLVVISIIGLLSSVVLASVNTARLSAKDTAIKQAVLEYRKLLELEYSDTGSYSNLLPSGSAYGDWIRKPPVALGSKTCSSTPPSSGFPGIVGNYGAQAISICENILSFLPSARVTTSNDNAMMIIGVASTQRNSSYSIMVHLPGESTKRNADTFYCLGSSGNQYVGSYSGGSIFNQSGCPNNP